MPGPLSALRALLPRRCPGCGQPLAGETGLCPQCQRQLRPTVLSHSILRPEVSPHLICLGEYRGVLRRAIREMKYGGARELAGLFGRALGRGLPPGWQPQAVVPVPLHPRREQARAFNQAEALARALAQEAGLPLAPLLRRLRSTDAQARLHADARAHNLDGAFEGRGPVPARVLLVDDVLTTRATLGACSRALRALGAEQICYAVVAR